MPCRLVSSHFELQIIEDGGSKFLRNVGNYLPIEKALYPTGLEASSTPTEEPQISQPLYWFLGCDAV
jgi:hypothetical protein